MMITSYELLLSVLKIAGIPYSLKLFASDNILGIGWNVPALHVLVIMGDNNKVAQLDMLHGYISKDLRPIYVYGGEKPDCIYMPMDLDETEYVMTLIGE
jgi:hypothetical protein